MTEQALPERVRKRWAAVAASTAILLLLGGCDRETSGPSDGDEDRGTPVAAMTLVERDLSRRVNVSAPVMARQTIRLASRSDGTVAAVHLEEGDEVTTGELLAELDVAEQLAELRRAQAEEERAELEYERMRELRESDNISAAEYQRARADLRIAAAERELWETRVEFGRIVAPRNAVITARLIEPGEAVNAQDTLFELAALDELVIQPGLSELDVVELETGQTLPVRMDAMPREHFEGTLTRIFPAADPVSRLITVEVALPADAAERSVKPGFLARLEFEVDRQSGVLALPASIVGSDEERGGRYVYVIEDGRLVHREVDTGLTRDGWTEITSGLETGETVLASNPIDMRDGQQVRVVQRRGGE